MPRSFPGSASAGGTGAPEAVSDPRSSVDPYPGAGRPTREARSTQPRQEMAVSPRRRLSLHRRFPPET